MLKGKETTTMKMSIVTLTIVMSLPVWAKDKFQVEVLESNLSTNSYGVPAQGFCLPGAYGPTCGVSGARSVSYGLIKIKAQAEGHDIWLSCTTGKTEWGNTKPCARLLPGKYTAESKGTDEVVVYAWANPLDSGNMKKARKLVFKIGARSKDE